MTDSQNSDPRTTVLPEPTRAEIDAGRDAANEAWRKWTGGRSSLDGMEFCVREALRAAARVRQEIASQ